MFVHIKAKYVQFQSINNAPRVPLIPIDQFTFIRDKLCGMHAHIHLAMTSHGIKWMMISFFKSYCIQIEKTNH